MKLWLVTIMNLRFFLSLIIVQIIGVNMALAEQLPHVPALDLNPVDRKDTFFSLNQVGYFPNMQKLAFAVNISSSSSINIFSFDDNKVIFTTSPEVLHIPITANEKLYISTVDISEIQKSGHYTLVWEGLRSPVFRVSPNPYRETVTTMLRSFYLQRCGVALNDPFTGLQHAACHTQDATFTRDYGAGELSASPVGNFIGGWHDAGDFGKYVSTTAITIARLLTTFSKHPEYFENVSLGIPESKNSLPDILDEVIVGLDWLLKMQRDDGAVYRKIGADKWPSSKIRVPESDRQERHVYGIATDDTAKFAGCMAIAYRVIKVYDKKRARKYLHAAKNAWKFLAQHHNFIMDVESSDDRGSGPYRLNKVDREFSLSVDLDDRIFAALELYISTRNASYKQASITLKNRYETEKKLAKSRQVDKDAFLFSEFPIELFEWKNPVSLGYYNYLGLKREKKSALSIELRKSFIAAADYYIEMAHSNAFSIANTRFVWGSNKMTAEAGLMLMTAYELTGSQKYRTAAIRQIDYLLGANAFSQSFVTEVGERSVRHVNHIYARGARIRIPGLLVGGPNAAAQAKIAPPNLAELSYVDDERTYAVNEYAIDYNASLIALLVSVEVSFHQKRSIK